MNKNPLLFFLLSVVVCIALAGCGAGEETVAAPEPFRLGNEVLFAGDFSALYADRRVGLLTNQTGVNSAGEKTAAVFYADPEVDLAALFAPEHGLDGLLPAGAWVENGIHTEYQIPVYSLHGDTRRPTPLMLADIDVLFVDLQDIGARSYTYISTLRYAMESCAREGKAVVVLDRPNPVGGLIVEGPVMDPDYITFVGCDVLPIAHGMTIGELALYFNCAIKADLTIAPMAGYRRSDAGRDTGLHWVPTSPNVPDVAAFCYMATGKERVPACTSKIPSAGWAKRAGQRRLCRRPERVVPPRRHVSSRGQRRRGGRSARDQRLLCLQPARTGLAVLAEAKRLTDFAVPKTAAGARDRVMFEKIAGGTALGRWLEEG